MHNYRSEKAELMKNIILCLFNFFEALSKSCCLLMPFEQFDYSYVWAQRYSFYFIILQLPFNYVAPPLESNHSLDNQLASRNREKVSICLMSTDLLIDQIALVIHYSWLKIMQYLDANVWDGFLWIKMNSARTGTWYVQLE